MQFKNKTNAKCVLNNIINVLKEPPEYNFKNIQLESLQADFIECQIQEKCLSSKRYCGKNITFHSTRDKHIADK